MTILYTIQDVIMARVDSLSEGAKGGLQVGSVVGRAFSQDLIQKVTGHWRSLPETRQMAEQGLYEIMAVAWSRGIALPAEALQTTMAMFDGLSPQSTFSLQRDVMEGHLSELEAQIGAVVRLGQEVGVATPLYTFIYNTLLSLELRAPGQVQFPA